MQGISCKTFPSFVIQGTVGDNVILRYLEALPAVLSASRWFVQKLQGCVAGTLVVQPCVLCRAPSRDSMPRPNLQPVENINTGTSQCHLFLSSRGYSVALGKWLGRCLVHQKLEVQRKQRGTRTRPTAWPLIETATSRTRNTDEHVDSDTRVCYRDWGYVCILGLYPWP